MRRYWIISILAMLGLGIASPAASASHARPERPFMASLSGVSTFEYPESCPPSCDEFTTVGELTGQATHLGRVAYQSTHHPYDIDPTLDGELTFTAANGDELYGVYDYGEEYPVVVTFTGGTGRFQHASGTATFTYEVIPQFQDEPCKFEYCFNPDVAWPMPSMMFVGTISY